MKGNIAEFPLNIASVRAIIDKRLEEKYGHPPSGGGSDMEARVARLEASVAHIEADVTDIKTDLRDIRGEMSSQFRWIIGIFITTFLALLGAMAKGFGWL